MSLAEEPPMQLVSEMFNSEFPFPLTGSTTQETAQYYASSGDVLGFVILCSQNSFVSANGDMLCRLLKTMLSRLDGIDRELSCLS